VSSVVRRSRGGGDGGGDEHLRVSDSLDTSSLINGCFLPRVVVVVVALCFAGR
jgi:hypothetical protein